MNLSLDEIFEILNDIDYKRIDEQKSPIKKSNKDKTIVLPKLQISEDWGQTGTPDRAVLQSIVSKATKGAPGKNPLVKLARLNDYLDLVISNLDKEYSISKLLSSIIIIETMMKMFNSFSPGPTGFLNEAFLSVFYGSDAIQVPASESLGVEDIIVNKSNQLISLKTVDAANPVIKGSLEGLKNSLNNDQFNNNITYHIFLKETSGNKIQNLRMHEIQIKRSSIPIFYSDNVDSSKSYMGMVYVVPSPTQQVPDTTSSDSKEKIVTTTQSDTIKEAKELPFNLKSPQPSPDQIDWDVAELKTVSLARGKSGIRDSKSFDIPGSVWINYTTTNKAGLFLDLSDERYLKVLKGATTNLNSQIVELFSSLEQFSNNITQFFAANNSNSGVKAYKNAIDLEKQTGKVISPESK